MLIYERLESLRLMEKINRMRNKNLQTIENKTNPVFKIIFWGIAVI